MNVYFTDRFKRHYKFLESPLKKKFAKQLQFLLTNPRHSSLQIHPVEGTEGIYEARVDLQYRFTFPKQGDTYILRVIGNHDEVLGKP